MQTPTSATCLQGHPLPAGNVTQSMDLLHISNPHGFGKNHPLQAGPNANCMQTPINIYSSKTSGGTNSTGKKRIQTSTQGLSEATTSGMRILIEPINRIHESTIVVEGKRSKDLVEVIDKQLKYF